MKFLLMIFFFLINFQTHAEKLSLLLDWYMNPNHAPLYVAQKLKFFEKKGLEVELTTPPDTQTPPKLVALGKADLALSYQYHLHLFVNQKLPLTRIATIIETPLNSLAVKADGPIKTIQDLKGKKIGFRVGLGSSQAFIQSLLQNAGLQKEDVTLIRSNQSLTAGFLSGQLDAITGIYRNVEPFLMADKGTTLRLFYYEENGVPPFDELIVVARNDQIHLQKIKLFVEALEEASQYLINHWQECLETYLKDYPEQKSDITRKIWYETLPRFALRPAALDGSRYQNFALYLKNAGLLDSIPPLDSYAKDIRLEK